MTIHLPEDLERYVQSEVLSGRFASPDEAISEALRLLRQKNQQAQHQPLTPDQLNRQLVEAAESCQVAIIHPGKPRNPNEPGLDELIKRAEPFL